MGIATITIFGVESQLSGEFPTKEIIDATSFYAMGYQFMSKFRYGKWDGRIRLFKRYSSKFPTGLLSIIKSVIEEMGGEVKVVDARTKPKVRPDTKNLKMHGVSFEYPYDFQLDCVQAMLKEERGVIFAATNAGKTEIACLASLALKVPTLFIVPGKELLYQTQRRFATRLGLNLNEVGIIGDGIWKPSKWITIAIMASLYSKLDQEKCLYFLQSVDLLFGDECFVTGTLVDGKPIETLKVGDLIWSFNEKEQLFTKKKITKVYVNKPTSLVEVAIDNKSVVCTPGHPFYTQRGWVLAGSLQNSDKVLCTRFSLENANESSILHTREISEKSCNNELFPLRETGSRFWEVRVSPSKKRSSLLLRRMQKNMLISSKIRAYEKEKSYAYAWDKRENEDYSESYGLEASSKGRKRNRSNCSTTTSSRQIGMGHRVSYSNQRKTRIRVSHSLQGRYRQLRVESCCRSRWLFPRSSVKTETRQEERPISNWSRVESVKVLKPGSDGKFGGMCPEGFVYNLEVENLHTYVANNCVVHNCHKISANTNYNVLKECTAYYRFGLSGTPLKRTDGADLRLIASTGQVIYEIRNKELIRRGISSEVAIHMKRVRIPVIPKRTPYPDVYKMGIVENEYRNIDLCNLATEYVAKGRGVVILVRELLHGDLIVRQFKENKNIPKSIYKFITGSESTEIRQKALKDFAAGTLKIMIATCFIGKTKISLLNGTEVSIKELTKRNKPFDVYSYDTNTNKIVVGKAHSARKTGCKVQTIGVVLDNNCVEYCTPEHLWLLRTGEYKPANKLKSGDSLMPLYRRIRNNYEEYTLPGKRNGRWHKTHQMVGHYKYGDQYIPNVTEYHHVDCNKLNNDLSNILLLTTSEHLAVHRRSSEEISRQVTGMWQDPEIRKKIIDARKEFWDSDKSKEIRQIAAERIRKYNLSYEHTKKNNGRYNHSVLYEEIILAMNNPNMTLDALAELFNCSKKVITNRLKFEETSWLTAMRKIHGDHYYHNGTPHNHKVKRIIDGPVEDVYDITVDKYHNFALSSGVFCHNSILDEGVDLPNIDVLIVAGGGKSSIKTLQRVGRGIRKGGTTDKLIVIDFSDFTHKYLLEHSQQRLHDYTDEDCFEIKDIF